MHLFTILEEVSGEESSVSAAPSLAAAIKAAGFSPADAEYYAKNWLPEVEGRDEWTGSSGITTFTISKVQLVSDGDDAFDSGVLELAAILLRKRYGIEGAGPTVRMLTELARAIAKEQ